MSLVALGLLGISALMHAGWNFIVKQAKYKQVFLCWAVLIGALCFSVLLFPSMLPTLAVWPYAVGSALLESAYFVLLTWAYAIDDFSRVYPLVRGTAPVFLFVWASLFLHEWPQPLGISGLLVLVVGLMLVGGTGLWSRVSSVAVSWKSILIALATATCISLYTVIDGIAVRRVEPAPYTALVFLLSGLFTLPTLWLRYGSQVLRSEWLINWWRILLVGIVMLLAYMLVLFTYTIARVSYAGAIREVSVVFAALLGWLWLGERFGRLRLLGSLCIFTGIVLIALAG